MNQIKNLKNLAVLAKLIHQERTGRPKQLAKRLSISCRTLYRKIGELNAYGMKIKYCRIQNTYYYSNDEVIDIHFHMKLVTETIDP
jgi:predicted DNA-binding transcriptional regulator YafY